MDDTTKLETQEAATTETPPPLVSPPLAVQPETPKKRAVGVIVVKDGLTLGGLIYKRGSMVKPNNLHPFVKELIKDEDRQREVWGDVFLKVKYA